MRANFLQYLTMELKQKKVLHNQDDSFTEIFSHKLYLLLFIILVSKCVVTAVNALLNHKD